MAVAFRAGSATNQLFGGGTTSPQNATESTGAALNDALILFVAIDVALTPTTPTGWTLLVGPINATNTTNFHIYVYGIRRGASAPSLSIAWTGGNIVNALEMHMAAYTGGSTSDPLFDSITSSVAAGSTATITIPSFNLTNINEMVVACFFDWAGGTWTGLTAGFTHRTTNTSAFDGIITDKLFSASGPTGAIADTASFADAGAAIAVAIIPPSSSTQTGTIEPIILPNRYVGPLVLRQNIKEFYFDTTQAPVTNVEFILPSYPLNKYIGPPVLRNRQAFLTQNNLAPVLQIEPGILPIYPRSRTVGPQSLRTIHLTPYLFPDVVSPSTQIVTGSANLSGTGSLSSGSLVIEIASSSLSGVGSTSIDSLVLVQGTSPLSGQGSFTADGIQLALGIVSLIGTGILSSLSLVIEISSATIIGTGSLTATAEDISSFIGAYPPTIKLPPRRRLRQAVSSGKITLSAKGSLSLYIPQSEIINSSQIILTSTNNLSVESIVLVHSLASLDALGSLTVSQVDIGRASLKWESQTGIEDEDDAILNFLLKGP